MKTKYCIWQTLQLLEHALWDQVGNQPLASGKQVGPRVVGGQVQCSAIWGTCQKDTGYNNFVRKNLEGLGAGKIDKNIIHI